MSIDKTTLITDAERIRNATQSGENTAERVGKLFVDIIEALFGTIGADQYLSRTHSDRSAGLVSSDVGFEVGHFVSGVSGGIIRVDEDGKSHAEVDYLTARIRAVFESLLAMEAKTIGGRFYISAGGGIKCTRVDEITLGGGSSAYRCWFLSADSDGSKSECRMEADDLAKIERFDAHEGENGRVESHYSWRRVVAVNNNGKTDEETGKVYGYIDLSVSDCDTGSDAPVAGDEICHFGSKSTDPADAYRKTVLMLSAVGDDAPCIKMFVDVDDYTLADCDVISLGYDNVEKKVFFRLGKSSDTYYLNYRQGEGLDLAGRLHISSTIGDSGATIGETITGTDTYFILSGSATEAPALPTIGTDGEISDPKGWTTTAPAWENGKFMWQTVYERTAAGAAKFSNTTCISGRDGRGIRSVQEQYYLSTSRTILTGGSWSNTPQPWKSGHYYWFRVRIEYTDGSLDGGTPVCIQGADGTDGYRIDLSNESALIACDYNGNVTGAYPTCRVSIWCGANELTLGNGVEKFELSATGIGASWTDQSSGTFKTQSITADTASVAVTATLSDGNTLVANMHIAKVRPGKPGDDAVLYEIIPSTNQVTCNAEGELSASTVSCTVYEITGKLRKLSNTHRLRAIKLPAGTVSQLSVNTLGASSGVQITSDVSAVRFELYDTVDGSEIIYDRETVPVLVDAAGFVGGDNILKGTNQGVKGWSTDTYAGGNTVSPMLLSPMQQAPFGLSAINNARYPYGGTAGSSSTIPSEIYYRLLYRLDSEFRLEAGTNYILSFDMVVNSKGLTYLTVDGFINSSNTIQFGDGWLWNTNTSGYHTAHIEVPLNFSDDVEGLSSLRFTFGNRETNVVDTSVSGSAARSKGEFYGVQVSNLKLERGHRATPWTASPRETNYLMEAMQEDITMENGLILAALIKLGYTDSNGQWKVGAGINGMLSPNASDAARKSLIMLWSGGDQIDAAVSPDDPNAATFLVRADGSVYCCRNIIRFLEGRMEMGDDLIVDSHGLYLRDQSSGEIYFRLTNESVGDEASMLERSVVNVSPTSATFNVKVHTASGGGSGIQLIPGYYIVGSASDSLYTLQLNSGSQVSSHGANLDLNIGVSLNYGNGNDNYQGNFDMTVVLEKRTSSTGSWTTAAQYGLRSATDGTAHSASCHIIATLDGGCYYRLRIKPASPVASTYSYSNTTASLSLNGKIYSGNSSTTLQGNDGFATAWPDSTLLMAKAGRIVAQVAGIGIRVIKDGSTPRLQFLQDGSYYNFNFAKARELGIITSA